MRMTHGMKFSKKHLIIGAACVVFTVAICISLYLFVNMNTKLKLKLNGSENIVINLGTDYTELGGSAHFGKTNVTDIEIDGLIDTETPGEYTLNYTAKYKDKTVIKQRHITVKDLTSPVISAPDSITVFSGKNLDDVKFEYTAQDNYDGDLTEKIIRTNNGQHIKLSVSDNSGNTTEKTVAVNYVDDVTPPTIKLNGSQNIYIVKGGTYNDQGCTAYDNADGDVTSRIHKSDNVNKSVPGTYSVTYTVTDSSQNTATAIRKVTVFDVVDGTAQGIQSNGKIIYLTFDDGPCVYTDQILDILAKYQIKATFFVTNQKPQYANRIGRAFREGHAIGAHTYSHKFDIYSSVETYFDDLDKINAVIEQQTGSRTNLIRFPGGSSNTVSKKYCPGIMTKLSKEVQNRGYYYFDWNVSSGDAGNLYDPYKIASNVTSHLSSSNSVVLMHDINHANIKSLPMIIEYGLSNGYSFRPLSTLSPTAHHGITN